MSTRASTAEESNATEPVAIQAASLIATKTTATTRLARLASLRRLEFRLSGTAQAANRYISDRLDHADHLQSGLRRSILTHANQPVKIHCAETLVPSGNSPTTTLTMHRSGWSAWAGWAARHQRLALLPISRLISRTEPPARRP